MGEYLSDQFNIKKDPSMLVASWQAEVSEQWTSAVSPMGWSSGALREVPYSHGAILVASSDLLTTGFISKPYISDGT